MKKILTIILTALTLWSCNSKGDGGEPDSTLYQIVTFEGYNADTQTSAFTYQVIDDSPLITLTASFRPSDELKEGTRLLIAYQTDTPGQSGPIELQSAAVTIGGDVKSAENPSVATSRTLLPVSVWRSGPYLNACIRSALNRGAVSAELVADKADPARLYVVVRQSSDLAIDAVDRTFYCSWSLAPIMAGINPADLTLTFKSLDGATQTITLTHTTNQ